MQIIRAIKSVQGNQVVIDLPKNFFAQQVEVIVIPYQPISLDTDRAAWQRDFKAISQWNVTEEQVKMTPWQIEEF